jgi:hypothetical protein
MTTTGFEDIFKRLDIDAQDPEIQDFRVDSAFDESEYNNFASRVFSNLMEQQKKASEPNTVAVRPVSLFCDYFGIVQTNISPTLEQLIYEDQKRAKKWATMFEIASQDNDSLVSLTSIKPKKFISRVLKGVPHLWRSSAWGHMISKHSGIYHNKKHFEIRVLEHELLNTYHVSRDQPCVYDNEIEMYLNETMRCHIDYQESGEGTENLALLCSGIFLAHKPFVCGPGMVKWLAMLLTIATEGVLM